MADIIHKNLTGLDAVHQAAISSSSDPGAIGANKFWVDTSSGPPYTLKKRNDANSAWEAVGLTSSTLFNDTEGNPTDVVGTGVSDGTSVYAARRDHIHELGIITTRGDLIRGGASGVPERVALGTSGQVFTSNGTDAVWSAPTGGGGGSGGAAGQFKQTKIEGQGNITTTSTTFVVMDNTKLPPLSVTLSIGDVVRCLLSGQIYNSSTGFEAVDWQVVQPTLGTVRANANSENGAGIAVGGTRIDASFETTFTATEAGAHTFQPVWRVSASTGTLANATSGNDDTIILHTIEVVGQPVLLTPASNLLYQTKLSATTSTIDTGALSQAYRDLRIEIQARGTTAAASVDLRMRANADSGASQYDTSRLVGSATAGASVNGAESSGIIADIAANTAPANAGDVVVVQIPNYSDSTYQKSAVSINSRTTSDTPSGNNHIEVFRWRWRSTAAISSLQFFCNAGDFGIGSTVRVYGEPVSAGGASVGTGTRLRISANLSVADATDTIVGFDTEDNDADSQHYTSSANLTGTVSKTAASATLPGVGTAFLTELSVGQVISVPGTAVEKRVVIAIASNTSLTVNTPYANTAATQTATRVNSALVFRQPGHYDLDAGSYWASNATGYRRLEFVLNDTTPFAQDAQTSIGAAAMGVTLSASKTFQMWDFVELRVYQNSGGALNLNTDERTFLSCNARPTVIVAVPYVNIQDQKAQNTAGGTFTLGADRTRNLTTVYSDSSGLTALASDQFTLPAGMYRYDISAPAHQVDRHQAFLYNVTDSVVVQRGTSEITNLNSIVTRSYIKGRMTISGTKTFEIRHRSAATKATDGLGVASNFGTEVYTVVEIWKEG